MFERVLFRALYIFSDIRYIGRNDVLQSNQLSYYYPTVYKSPRNLRQGAGSVFQR